MTKDAWVWWSWNLVGDLRVMLQYEFIRNAFVAGTIIAILAGIVSYLVVLRRSSFAAHALGHVGFSGAAGAVLFAVAPIYGLLLFTTVSGTGIALLGQKASHRDVEIGTVLAFMLGLGLLFLAFYNGFATEAYSILFGEIVGISTAQVWFTFWTTVIVLGALAVVYRQLLFASLDEEVAEAKGMHTLALGVIFMLALAVAVSIAVTIIGVLLIFALTVTPAAIAIRLAKRPLYAVLISVGVALFATWAGIFIAFYEIEPTSFFIVTIVFVIYVVVRVHSYLVSRGPLFASQSSRTSAAKPPLELATPSPAPRRRPRPPAPRPPSLSRHSERPGRSGHPVPTEPNTPSVHRAPRHDRKPSEPGRTLHRARQVREGEMIPTPHGGRLIHRLADDAERDKRDAELRDLPKFIPFIDQLYDADKIGIGAYSPLEGFQGSEAVEAVVARGRLPDGLPWTIPIFLPAPVGPARAELKDVGPGDEIAMLNSRGTAIALLKVEEEFPLDRGAIAQGVYGTKDPAHPNVADLLAAGDTAWAGPITLLRRLQIDGPAADPTPADTRADFARRGWKTVAAYQCRNPPHTAHEYIQRLTLEREDVDALFVHPVVGRLKKGDYRPEVILEAYEALVRNYYPASRVVVQPLGITMRYGGPKAALFLAIIRKNFGCGVYIVGRDQAGVGKYYDPYACHRIFDQYDLGILPLRYEESFFCRRCGWMASEKVCPHDLSNRVQTSQTRIREALATGADLPGDILRPEVAAVLRRPDIILTE